MPTTPSPPTNPNDEVIRRSRALKHVQVLAGVPIAAGMVAVAPWIGWRALIPLAAMMAIVIVLRRPGVQRRFGAATAYLIWGVGTLGNCGVSLLADGRVYYVVPIVAVPTVMAITVFPVRQIPWMSLAMTIVILITCYLADPSDFRDDPGPSVVTAALLGVVIQISGMARRAETDSFLESRVDPLTGVQNRLALDEYLEALPAAQFTRPWTLIVGDIDNFKALNDRHGHATGDRALREVAQAIRQQIPENGRLYRFGGEEFLVSLMGTDPEEAQQVAERIRRAVSLIYLHGNIVTMSLGVASTPATETGRFDRLFARADEAMYRAKAAGRNMVMVAPPPTNDESQPRGGDRSRIRRTTAATPQKGALLQGWFEREHMIDMMTRQYQSSHLVDILLVLPLIVFSSRLGYTTTFLAIAAIAVFRFGQAILGRVAHPGIVLSTTWIGTQTLVSMAVLRGVEPWGLFALGLLVVATAAAIPWRLLRWGSVLSACLIVIAALIHRPDIFSSAPQAVVVPLIFLAACAIVGRELGQRIVAIRRAALHDGLTGLPNRTAFQKHLLEELDQATRHHEPVSLIMADIDHFKDVNDRFGHSRGDAVLIAVTSRLQSRLRQTNSLHRVGGEEFAILVPGVDEGAAAEIAERLRETVSHGATSGVALTMSFGVASGTGTTNPDDLFRRADLALYRAKDNGRNRVERASGNDGPQRSDPPAGGQVRR